jgi:hypothetical protein
MAFITLRRSRNTKSYYLVESYRDGHGRSRKRTLCYLGRESDGTDTLVKSLSFWEDVRDKSGRELLAKTGRKAFVHRRRHESARAKVALLNMHLAREREAEARRKEAERRIEEAVHWQAFERLRHQPNEENARAAKKAFLTLAKSHHPDQGGRHEDFLRVKDAYDRATALWKRMVA